MKIAITDVCRADKHILHRRLGDRTRGAIGLIGFFGGEIEPDEEYDHRLAAQRELGEETNIKLSLGAFMTLGEVAVMSDRNNQPIEILASAYSVVIPVDFKVSINDWNDEIVVADLSQMEEYLATGQLTPATAKAFENYIPRRVLNGA